jgi:hypothetical protein
LVNLSLGADHVWLVSDTLQFATVCEPHAFTSKASVYPHLYAMAANRGLSGMRHRLDQWATSWGRVRDAEDASRRLPALLCKWSAELDGAAGQVWLAGWRPSIKSFGGWRFESPDFEAHELPVPGTYLNPGNDLVAPPAVLASPEPLIAAAKVQREMSGVNIQHGGEDLGIGGELVLFALTRDGFDIRKVHRFDDYAVVKAGFDGRQ